jgi:hypothetical protein
VTHIFLLVVLGVLTFVALPFSCYMLWRNNAVYKERTCWNNEFRSPAGDDPDFWVKLRLVGSNTPLLDAVSYDEMLHRIWIPIPRWKEIARARVEAQKAKEGKTPA